MYSRIKPTKSTASDESNFSEPEANVTSRESALSRVCVDQCVSAIRAVEVAVFVVDAIMRLRLEKSRDCESRRECCHAN